jgi:hypothetical protein
MGLSSLYANRTLAHLRVSVIIEFKRQQMRIRLEGEFRGIVGKMAVYQACHFRVRVAGLTQVNVRRLRQRYLFSS